MKFMLYTHFLLIFLFYGGCKVFAFGGGKCHQLDGCPGSSHPLGLGLVVVRSIKALTNYCGSYFEARCGT